MSRLTINSNIASLNAQRNFANATKKLSESYTRLSSGLRINRAVDDAAGLSISESLKADIRILNQGIRNLNDGASLLNIADGALGELSSIVTRLSELAQQSANGTIGHKQRSALDQEAQALSKEYNRIARSTEFNGNKIFDSSFGDLSLAAGGSRNSLVVGDLGGAIGNGTFSNPYTIPTNVGSANNSVRTFDINNDGNLDLVTADYNGAMWRSFGNGDGTFGSPVSMASAGQPYDISIKDLNNDGNLDLAVANVSASSVSIYLGNQDGSFRSFSEYAGSGGVQSLSIGDFNGDGVEDIVATSTATNNASVFIGNGNGTFRAQTTFRAAAPSNVKTFDFNSDGILDLGITSTGSAEFYIQIGNGNGSFKASATYSAFYPTSFEILDLNNDGNMDIATGGNVANIALGNGDGTFRSTLTIDTGGTTQSLNAGDINGDGITDLTFALLYSSGIMTLFGNSDGTFKSIQTISDTAIGGITLADLNADGVLDISGASSGGVQILFGNSNSGVANLANFSLKNQAESKQAISYFRTTLSNISKQRGEVGAFQSRIETATSNLKQSALTYSDAASRITDADIAEESSKLVANQILQQSAASVLAQANQQPRLVLQLMEGI